MKKLALLVFFTGLLMYSCSSNDDGYGVEKQDGEISTKSISLSDTVDYPGRIDDDDHVGKKEYLYRIKDADTLRDFMYLDDDSIAYKPTVDFNKESVLVALGTSNSGITKIEHKYRKIAEKQYVLEVDLWLNEAMVAPRWAVAVIVPLLKDDDEVNLIVNRKY